MLENIHIISRPGSETLSVSLGDVHFVSFAKDVNSVPNLRVQDTTADLKFGEDITNKHSCLSITYLLYKKVNYLFCADHSGS